MRAKSARALRGATAVVVLLTLGACKSSTSAPDPASFGPTEEAKVDPRAITFFNGSVEMAELEIFAPAAKIKDCQAEAPHRLLCPTDYKVILDQKVYPRTKAEAAFPAALPLECGQVWVRVHTKAMQPDESREAIFLLPGEGEMLGLELGEGEAARLDHKGYGARYRFPPPTRYCDPDLPDASESPKENIRTEAQVTKALAAIKPALEACCKDAAACRGVTLRATLTLHRDGSVHRSEATGPPSKDKGLNDCLLKAVDTAHFPGFTANQSTAEVTLRLPIK